MDSTYLRSIESELFACEKPPESIGGMLAETIIGNSSEPPRNDYVTACSYNLIKASFIFIRETDSSDERNYENLKTCFTLESGRRDPPIDFLFKEALEEAPKTFARKSTIHAFKHACTEYQRFSSTCRLESALYCKRLFDRLVE